LSRKLATVAALLLCAAAVPAFALAGAGHRHRHNEHGGGDGGASAHRHVLLISVDGLHAADLRRWVSEHPDSTLGRLSREGTTYANARSPVPTDSFPGLLALVTGGTPRSTGVYYDNSYDRSLYAPGTQSCTGQAGTNVLYDESVDYNDTLLSGGGSPGFGPSSIDPSKMPLAPVLDAHGNPTGQCKPVYPHQFLRVNTIFNVAHDAGLRTAWSDKHPAYDLVNGPSGNGVDDLYTPEIASVPVTVPATEGYDSGKVDAVLNEIAGYGSQDGAHQHYVGTPAILGMNFQSVSVAEKDTYYSQTTNPSAHTYPCQGSWPDWPVHLGGYCPDGSFTPQMETRDAAAYGSVGALDFVDAKLGELVDALRARGLAGSTEIIVTAKHGQSPVQPQVHQRVDDGPLAAKLVNPAQDQLTDDDGALMWFRSGHQGAVPAAVRGLQQDQRNGNPAQVQRIVAGDGIRQLFGDPARDPRVPDVLIQPITGVVYSGSQKKVAEHGGAGADDRHVALLVAGPSRGEGGTVDSAVSTTGVASTVLDFLGLSPARLDAVRTEQTRALPGGD
jgi:hypothetical protein